MARRWDSTAKHVLLFTGYPILAAQVFRCFQHATGHRIIDAARCDATTGKGILEFKRRPLKAPARAMGKKRRVTHGFSATGYHDIRATGCYLKIGINQRLQTGAAASIELQPALPLSGKPASSATTRPSAGASILE